MAGIYRRLLARIERDPTAVIRERVLALSIRLRAGLGDRIPRRCSW